MQALMPWLVPVIGNSGAALDALGLVQAGLQMLLTMLLLPAQPGHLCQTWDFLL